MYTYEVCSVFERTLSPVNSVGKACVLYQKEAMNDADDDVPNFVYR